MNNKNYSGRGFIFLSLMFLTGYLIFHFIRVTFFNQPMVVFHQYINHELSLIICLFGFVISLVLMLVIFESTLPERLKTIWPDIPR